MFALSYLLLYFCLPLCLFIYWRVFLFPVICKEDAVCKYKYARKTHTITSTLLHENKICGVFMYELLIQDEIWLKKERKRGECIFLQHVTIFYSSCVCFFCVCILENELYCVAV